MAVSDHHWALLEKAARAIEKGAFERYFELKRLLASGDCDAFQREFTAYYRLNIGGLTPAFKKRYFQLLFDCAPVGGQADPYTPIFLDLHTFERRKGGTSIQASFVSKLVAIHDESRPIYDRHVSNFFGMGVADDRQSALPDCRLRGEPRPHPGPVRIVGQRSQICGNPGDGV